MKRWLGYVVAIAMLVISGIGLAAAQKSPHAGQVIVPPSNVLAPQDVGKRMHTNFLIFVPGAQAGRKPSPMSTIWTGGETPSSMACVYQTGPTPAPGCPVSSSNYDNPVGGSRMIAIVDAYDYPTAAADFQTFSQQFGLPYGNACGANGTSACLSVVYASGSQPQSNCGWAQEAALDIEWAHAMAPKAQIVLVEAASNSFSNLFQAVSVASSMVANAGGGQVSMSWGGNEFSSESVYDSYFTTPGVTYFASSGDTGGVVIYPSSSPNVISAGGTTVNRNSSGNFTGESAWSSAGAGPSAYEPVPSYQSGIYTLAQLLNGFRGTPDYSFDANPASGVSVYDSTSCQGYSGWLVFGGTSVASPSLAGIFNLAGAFDGGWNGGSNSSSVSDHIYQSYNTASSGGTVCNYQSPFYDVTSGSAGTYPASACWDFATGIGSGRGVSGLTGSTDFTISASPSSQSVDQGASTSYTASVNYSSGFAGTVSLSATGLPTGATASFSPSSLSASGSSTMSVSADSSTAAGTYTVTITGTSGSVSHSTTVTLVVNATSTGDFSLSALPTSQTVTQGSSTSYGISVSPSGGFTGTVDFSVSGLPSNATAGFNPTSVGGGSGSTTLSVTTASNTPTGTYTLTITGTSGTLSHPITVSLQVNSASSGTFSLGASSATITVAVNSSSSDTITVTPSSGFTGSVSLSLSGLPIRTSSSFSVNPVSISGSSGASSTLTISTNKKTTTGTYTLTLTATSGSLTQTLPLTLVVGSTSSPDFSLSASPSSQTISPGANTSYSVNVSASGGFTGTVSFAVSGLPSGASSTLPSVGNGSGSSTLSITTTSSIPTGTYPLTISGTSGALTHSTIVTLVVSSSTSGDFTLSASPTSQSVSAGSGTSYTVSVGALNGFSGTVALSGSSSLPHSSISFSPASVAGSGSSILTISTWRRTNPGTYTITITGTSGSSTHTTSVQLVVQ